MKSILPSATALGLIALAATVGMSRAQTTILSEGFEGEFPGAWSVGDDNSAGVPAYWKDVNAAFGGAGPHTGNWKGYCAGVGYGGTSDKPTYQSDMSAYLSRTLDLSGYTSARLTFWHKLPSIETCCDRARVVLSGIDPIELWSSATPVSEWTLVTIDLSTHLGGLHTLSFRFDADPSVTAEGWYLDDILVTGSVPPVNDDCEHALPLLDGVLYTTDTTAADADNQVPLCQSLFGKGVWFTYTPAADGMVEVSTCGSDFDTVLQVYAGPLCRVMTEVPEGCNDDHGPACTGSQASVRFAVTAGVPHKILAGGYNGASGTLQLVARWVDTEPPEVICPADLTLEADPGQCSRSNVIYSVTASDNADVLSLVCTPPSGSTFPVGTTVVTCVATDKAGNTNECAFQVTVQDVEPPRLDCPESLLVETTDVEARVVFDVTARDNCDPRPLLDCTPPSGSVLPLGTHAVHCVATDSAGNRDTCRFSVTVTQSVQPPTIKVPPQSATVLAGQPAVFEVTAEGTPPLAYQWYFNGQAMPDATEPAHVIERALPSHAGEYTVRVSNASGVATSQPAVLMLELTNKVDRWASDAIQTALATEVYAELRAALEAQGYRAQPWKAQVQWGFDYRSKDPRPVCQAVTVFCPPPAGSDRVALIGVLLGIGPFEDRQLLGPHPILGGVALIADREGGQRTVMRILYDWEGPWGPLEVLEDACLADWFHPATAPPEAPTFTAMIADLVGACMDCASVLGTEGEAYSRDCPRAMRAMGLFTYCVLGICLPPEFQEAIGPAPGPLSGDPATAEAVSEAISLSPIDGTQSCCGWDPEETGIIGGIVGGATGGFDLGGGLVGAILGGLAALFELNDDEAEWCIAHSEQYVVLEGTVGRMLGPVWLGQAGGLPTHFSSEDSPFTHDSLDWIIDVSPFSSNEAWPGSPDYTWLASQFNKTVSGQRQIECEWESEFVPDFIRTWPGDRVWIRGQLIFDCGHPAGVGGAWGYRSEIHPPHAIVTLRFEGAPLADDGLVLPARVARVYITPWAGEANHPDDINEDGRVWSSGAAGTPRFDSAHTPYQFKIPLPPKPSGCDLTPGSAPPVLVRIEPAAGLGLPATWTVDGAGLRVTRQQAAPVYLHDVISVVEVSLWPQASQPACVLVKVPVTEGPIPDLGGGVSPIQLKIAVGWNDAPLALQVSAAMPILDNIGPWEVPAAESPVIISPAAPLASGRDWVPPDRRTRLRVTGPDCGWQVTPLRVDFTGVQVNEDHDWHSSGEYSLVAGANGEWRALPGLSDVDGGDDVSMNVPVTVGVWHPSDPRLEIAALGYEGDDMDWGLDQDDVLGRVFIRHTGALGVDASPHLDILSTDGDYQVDYRVSSAEDSCVGDLLDPANDQPDTATGIPAPGSRFHGGLRVGPSDTADWFALDTDDYMTLTASLIDQTAQDADRCRTYNLQVVTERAVIPPDPFDDGLILNTPCGSGGGGMKVQEFGGRNETWAGSPILYLCPSAFSQMDYDCAVDPLPQDLNPDALVLENLNFHLPYPGLDATPDRDFYRIQLPMTMTEQCAAPCPKLLNGKFHPTALTILIQGDRNRPVLVTVTNFTTGFVLDNDPATPIPDTWTDGGHTSRIARNGTQTMVELECPRGSGLFADGMVGLALADPEGQRNFYDLSASYNARSFCDIDRLLQSPGMPELILGKLWGNRDPMPVRFLPILTPGDPADQESNQGKSMPFLDQPVPGNAWSDDDRWLVLLPRGQTAIDILVEPPPGASVFDVSIELHDLQDQALAFAFEVEDLPANPATGSAGAISLASAGATGLSTDGDAPPKHYRLETGQLDGCFHVLKVTRPQPGGRFTFDFVFTKNPAMLVSPGTISFGNRSLGTTSPAQQVTINNTGAASLIVADLSLAGPEAGDFALGSLPILPVEIQPGAELQVALTFRPTRPSLSSAELIIASNSPFDPEVRVSLEGFGQEGDLEPPRLHYQPELEVWTCESGAKVDYSVSATDDHDTVLAVVCSPPSGSWFGLGTNWVHCAVADSSGRSTEGVFAVRVIADTEPPEIQAPTNRVVQCMGTNGAVVFYEVEARDHDGVVTLTCSTPSGAWFPLGETLVTCEAVDVCGNRSQCTFPVVVEESGPVPLAIHLGEGRAHLGWPASCRVYILDTTTNLTQPIQWLPILETPGADGENFSAIVEITNVSRYFRLRCEP